MNAIGAVLTLAIWYFTHWVPVTLGETVWPSVVMSTVLGAGFAVTGGALACIFFPRRAVTSQ